MKKKVAVKKALKYQQPYSDGCIQSQSVVVTEIQEMSFISIKVSTSQHSGEIYINEVGIDPANLRKLISTLADLYQHRLNRDAENDNS
tara:strand:- start:4376 stop:4639 length:264 start_codon:yes stop_codon:yes gene_type:complete